MILATGHPNLLSHREVEGAGGAVGGSGAAGVSGD